MSGEMERAALERVCEVFQEFHAFFAGAFGRISVQRVRETLNRKPGGAVWAIHRQNLDGSEPHYYLSDAPEDTPLETLAYV